MGIRDGNFSGAPGDRFAPHFSVRSDCYRYTLCGNGEDEFYDHEGDPNEWSNHAGNPEYAITKKQLRGKLMNILRTTRMPQDFGPGQAEDE